jgi:hypothetical protein
MHKVYKFAFTLTMSIALALILTSDAKADNFSFIGNFTQDDNVQLFSFTVGASSNVTLRTWSYAGGVNAQGQTIARGGFDPILALFDSTGGRIGQNDDGGGNVPADINGFRFDTFLQVNNLAASTYTVSVMQFNNFAPTNLNTGTFSRAGQGNFTANFDPRCTQGQFVDVTGTFPNNCRDSHWAFDVLGVNAAIIVNPTPPTAVPEPATMLLLGTGLAGVAAKAHNRRKANKSGEV